MKKYTVYVTRTRTATIGIEIEAETEDQAVDKAMEEVQMTEIHLADFNECEASNQCDYELNEVITDEWAVIHADSGEEVKGSFTSEADAYQWLRNACASEELSPCDMDAYYVEKSDY